MIGKIICKVCLKTILSEGKHQSYHNECFRHTFGTITIAPTLPFSRKEFKTHKAQTNHKRFSISGVQPKLLINIQEDSLDVTQTGGTHIIKVSPEEYPYAAENEHLSMKIFRLMKIQTAFCGLMPLKEGELVYITKRFDREKEKKIHQEDMMQAMGIANIDNSKYDSKSYEDVGLFLLEHGKNLIVVGDFFKRVVLNFLIGNDDYHLKNISIRPEQISDGLHFLTPIYDSLNTEIYHEKQSARGEMALTLFKENGGFSERFDVLGFHSKFCFNSFAINIGLNTKFTNTFYTDYEKQFPNILELITNSYLPEAYKEKYKQVLIERLEKLNKN